MERRSSSQLCEIRTSSSESLTLDSSHSGKGPGLRYAANCPANILIGLFGKHQAFQQRIAGHAVGAVQSGAGDLAYGVKSGNVGSGVFVGQSRRRRYNGRQAPPEWVVGKCRYPIPDIAYKWSGNAF